MTRTRSLWASLMVGAWACASCMGACGSSGHSPPPTGAALPTRDNSPQASSNAAVLMPQQSAPATMPPAAGGNGSTKGRLGAAAGSGVSAPVAGAPPMAAAGAAPSGGAAGAGVASKPSVPLTGPLMGSCPAGYMPKPGMNTDFPGPKGPRNFILNMPAQPGGEPSPLFVALTGTLQDEAGFVAQSGLGQLVNSGWIVVAPVRSCAQEKRECNQMGKDGRVWEPWFDGTIPPGNDAGPDVKFVEDLIHCIAAVSPVAAAKIYAGGISAGGSFTHRNLTFNSKLFAGGIPASGNWSYGVAPASAMTMDPSIVIVVWGGPNDTFPGSAPYADETKAAAMYYAGQPNVVTVSCSGNHGHAWPTAMTPWLIDTLLSHPKGTPKDAFQLKPPPSGLTCVLGAYTDH